MSLNFIQILNCNFWGNSVKSYLFALAAFVLTVIVLKIFKTIIVKKLKRWVAKTAVEFDDLVVNIVDSIGWLFYFFLAFYIALRFIQIPESMNKIVSVFLYIVIAYYIVKGLQTLIGYGAKKVIKKREAEDAQFDSSIILLAVKILNIILWLTALLIILQNFGYNVSTLVAGLGLGGIAIAFALQNILGDIFAAFSIYFDKPFQTGDFIIVGEDMGTVKSIGIKSTRIQTLQGQELVIPNKELTETRVNNYKKMEKRRIEFSFGVVYETPTEKIKKIPQIIKKIMDNVERADIDRVHFKKFGDFSLNFEVVYYIDTGDYNQYMDIQQEINLAIKEEFEKEKIEMAFPTQTIFVNK